MMADTVTNLVNDPDIDRIISFWFDPRYPYMRWFNSSSAFDAQIASSFGSLVSTARKTTNLDHWAQSPVGTLALLLLLDQFPRNISRDSADAYSSDPKALAIATRAIAQGFDRDVPLIQQVFFYMPMEHGEQLLSQIACVSFDEGWAARCKVGSSEREFADKIVHWAIRHRNVIACFGRFPARNSLLHRQSTPEEEEFLKTHSLGF